MYKKRIEKLRKIMKEKGWTSFLVNQSENIFYLSGFKGSNGRLYIDLKNTFLITDFRYLRSAKKQVPSFVKIHDQSKGLKALVGEGLVIAIDYTMWTHSEVLALKKALKGNKWRRADGVILNLRKIKDDHEIKMMKEGVEKANQIFLDFVKTIKKGQSEKEMEFTLYNLARGAGAQGFSFDPIIAFGDDTANVHHSVTDRRLKRGESILIDFGIKYKDYMTDMTRVVYTKALSKKQKEIYEVVLRANQKAIKSIELGTPFRKIDEVARSIIEKAGYGKYFGHSTGHGVGIQIHELPNVSAHSEDKIQPGMVITIEPGIYTDFAGGVRIEDMVYINKKGQIEVLTASVSKEINVISL